MSLISISSGVFVCKTNPETPVSWGWRSSLFLVTGPLLQANVVMAKDRVKSKVI